MTIKYFKQGNSHYLLDFKEIPGSKKLIHFRLKHYNCIVCMGIGEFEEFKQMIANPSLAILHLHNEIKWNRTIANIVVRYGKRIELINGKNKNR